jgi:dolichyl-phosphate beta-glucosyltransferase
MPDFSIVIPTYNGAKILDNNLPVLFDILNKYPISYEVIIVSDGSKDNDSIKAVALKYNCLFISYEINMGKGYAVRKGVEAATGKYILFTDTDIPFKESAFDRMIKALQKDEFDVVIGDRTLNHSSYYEEISSSRKLGSKVFTFVVSNLITGGFSDTQCGFKGFKHNIAKKLFKVSRVNSFAFDVEIIYISLKRKYIIERIPVELRNSEDSTVSLAKHAPKMLADIFSLKFNHLFGRYNEN